ncbi:MAG: tRNA uridine-5-carboxymethylaminomethyl(34) synthesis GTPase MnmE [Clostridiales bacterium]|jgi:tRNA modification GTPase|nr:tRNA uridine-5-carboxymethylaminomethyl(34) synthesis GTPase MnmE [Clostridiales bacterium]
MLDDTIAAISTPPGEGGIGIVRMSGPNAINIGSAVFCFHNSVKKPQSHRLYYGYVKDPEDGRIIDEALIAFMRAPYTYTREDVVEINCHGGALPVSKTLGLVLAAGARMAEPGEFTQRAFLNGRIDLAQAEAVIQIIRAKTETAMVLGMSQLRGRLSGAVREIRQTLLKILAHMEASIDYPEHQDVEELARGQIVHGVEPALSGIATLLETADRGRILREGIRTAIVGRPNVGKSSLLNALLHEQRAIVTAIPGTTRDVLEESINLGGVALTIIDTAGIRETVDQVERIGVARSREALEKADLVLFVMDASLPVSSEDREILAAAGDRPCIVVANKTDLLQDTEQALHSVIENVSPRSVVPMSLLFERGLAALEQTIMDIVFRGEATAPEHTMVTSTRHKDALRRAQQSLQEMLRALEDRFAIDLLAIDLHTAMEALGEITGEAVREDLAEEIFRAFCIGK